MLTSTYTLVALSIEHTTVRAALQVLADELLALPAGYATLASARAVHLRDGLRRAVEDCHWRKLDKFLVPVLRHNAAAHGLLGELECLSRDAAAAMGEADACVGDGDRPVDRARFGDAVEACIAALRRRLEREEKELFPLARGSVGGDAWFAIANQMLAHDAYAEERRSDSRARRAHGRKHHDFERDPAQPDGVWKPSILSGAH